MINLLKSLIDISIGILVGSLITIYVGWDKVFSEISNFLR